MASIIALPFTSILKLLPDAQIWVGAVATTLSPIADFPTMNSNLGISNPRQA